MQSSADNSSQSRRVAIAQSAKHQWTLRGSANSQENLSSHVDFFETRANHIYGPNTAIAADTKLLSLLPSPKGMKDLSLAVDRILLAIQNHEQITIFGDYDVDGTTSCAMLKLFFDALNVPVNIYIPDRLIEGYGLNATGLKKIAASGGGLVITVDNGIAAVDACRVASELGLTVIITDHHDLPPELPQAFAILNPKQIDCPYPYRMLAGVGVAFCLMTALRAALIAAGNSKASNVSLRSFLDFVALGTIADMAPLDGVNHILCRVGLEVMAENIHRQIRPGIAQLLTLAGWDGASPLDASDIGFKIGPRLNAAGRLGTALAATDILSTVDPLQAAELAAFLHAENTSRQQIEKQMTSQAFDKISNMKSLPAAFVLHHDNWHSGVVGLVASRVLERFYKPTLALCTLNGKIKGSGRSTHAFDLFSVLNKVRHKFIAFGGHFHACGLTIEPENLPWLTEYLNEQAELLLTPADILHPLHIDGLAQLNTFTAPFLEKLSMFEPYGIENPRPRWLVKNIEIAEIKSIGKSVEANHAKVKLSDSFGSENWFTAFGLAEDLRLVMGSKIDFVIEGRISFWKGNRRPELRIVDFLPQSV